MVAFSQGPAQALRHDVEQGAQSLKDKLQIELQADMRHGAVRYGGQIFNVKVGLHLNRLSQLEKKRTCHHHILLIQQIGKLFCLADLKRYQKCVCFAAGRLAKYH